jgi:hypothetical protein
VNDYPYEHPGHCECGAVSFSYRCAQPLEKLAARACQCDYCRPRALAYLSEPNTFLRVTLGDQRYLYAHSFATHTADFYHCALCNTPVFVKSHIDGRDYALVVANALDGFAELGASVETRLDEESLAERLQRRSGTWIGGFEMVENND